MGAVESSPTGGSIPATVLHVPVAAGADAEVMAGRLWDLGAISIDPGSCFGSGSHPTTRMLLTLLERVVDEACAPTVLDVGTGSGILAVAAARLGAGRVTAIDIDPASPSVTLANAAVNGVADRIQASTTPLEALPADERFDVVVANLSAATIAELAPALIARTAAGGILLLSGL